MTDFTSEPTKRRRGSVFKTFARKRRRQQQMIRDSREGVNGAAVAIQINERTTTARGPPATATTGTNDHNAIPPAAEQSERFPNPTSTTATPPEAPPKTDDALPSSSSSLSSNSDSKAEDGSENDSTAAAAAVAATTTTTKPKGWSCERCTLWNEMKNRRCTVCNARRPPADKLQQQAFAAPIVAETPRAGVVDSATRTDEVADVVISHVVTTQKSETHTAKRKCKVDAKALEGSLVVDVNELAGGKGKLHSTTSIDSREDSKIARSSKNTKSSPSSPSSSGRRKKATTRKSSPNYPKDLSSRPQSIVNENCISLKQPEKNDQSEAQAAQEHELSVQDTNRINKPAPSSQQNPSVSSMPPPPSNSIVAAATEQKDVNTSNSTEMDPDVSRLVREDSSTDNTRTSCLEAKLDKVICMLQLQERKNLRLQDEIQKVLYQNKRLEDRIELLLQRQDKFDARMDFSREETKSTETAATVATPARVSNVGASTPITKTRESQTSAPLDTVIKDGANHRTEVCAPPERSQVPKTHKTSVNTLEGKRVSPREESHTSPLSNRTKSLDSSEKGVSAHATHLEGSQPPLSCPSPAASTQTIDPDPHCTSTAKTLDFGNYNANRPRKPPTGGPRLDFVPTTAKRQNRDLEPAASRPTAQQGVLTNNNSVAPNKPSQPLKNSTNANPKQQSPSAGADGWISNKNTRQFLREMDAGAVPANAEANGEWLETRSVRITNTAATTRNALHSGRQPSSRDALWEESQEPGYAYQETVRCKAVREGLPCHDCEQCRKFYQTLRDTGHEFSQDPIHFSRHRSRFAPSETPVDFWELDFIDERDAERQRRQS